MQREKEKYPSQIKRGTFEHPFRNLVVFARFLEIPPWSVVEQSGRDGDGVGEGVGGGGKLNREHRG